jgi:hypothetical protein
MQEEAPRLPRLVGRPSKLSWPFLEVAERVLNTDQDAIILTDQELFDSINEQLAPSDQVSLRTFERWKAKAKAGEFAADDWQGAEFCRLYKKALRDQKKALFVQLGNEKFAWQKWAWIIERKFDEWNLRHVAQVEAKEADPIGKLTDEQLENEINRLLAK